MAKPGTSPGSSETPQSAALQWATAMSRAGAGRPGRPANGDNLGITTVTIDSDNFHIALIFI